MTAPPASASSVRALVVTIVHDPRDARIAHREIPALLDAGFDVTYAAPFTAYGTTPDPRVRGVDVPRAAGRRRLAAIRSIRRVLRTEGARHDVVILHDPEILLAAPWATRTPIIWDVHEDFVGVVESRVWIPRPARAVMRWVVGAIQRIAERHTAIILAEDSYARLFSRPHPVVPNSTRVPPAVPPADGRRVVYLGSVTASRGADMLIQTARLLHGHAQVHVYGPAHEGFDQRLRDADAAGQLTWHGFTPNDIAMQAIEGAALGLSFVRDEPNYRHSRLTKLMEYLAHGVPLVSTPLPVPEQLVADSGGGVLVGFDDPEGAARTIRDLLDDAPRRAGMAAAGHRYVLEHHNWDRDAVDFVAFVREVARPSSA